MIRNTACVLSVRVCSERGVSVQARRVGGSGEQWACVQKLNSDACSSAGECIEKRKQRVDHLRTARPAPEAQSTWYERPLRSLVRYSFDTIGFVQSVGINTHQYNHDTHEHTTTRAYARIFWRTDRRNTRCNKYERPWWRTASPDPAASCSACTRSTRGATPCPGPRCPAREEICCTGRTSAAARYCEATSTNTTNRCSGVEARLAEEAGTALGDGQTDEALLAVGAAQTLAVVEAPSDLERGFLSATTA